MNEKELKLVSNHDFTPDLIFLRVAELSLKKGNRPFFERKLKENIKHRLNGCEYSSIESLRGGYIIHLKPGSPHLEILERLGEVAGLAWFAPAGELPRKLEKLSEAALENGLDLFSEAETFAVRTQRSDKSFPHTSMECSKRIGGEIDSGTDLNVDLDNPDVEVNVHLLSDRAILFYHRFEGFRGLPVGTSADVLCLLSGGIDSPVAALRMLRRGCRCDFLHFYNYSEAKQALEMKMGELIEQLSRYGSRGRVHLVPDLPFELGGKNYPRPLEMVLFRRHVLRVATKLADAGRAEALVTGESLGQVASQTIENLTTIAGATDLPLLRPLVGMNKQEIIDFARTHGTYEISTRDYRDCCAILARHPETKASPDEVREAEQQLEVEKIDAEALNQSTTLKYDQDGLTEVSNSQF